MPRFLKPSSMRGSLAASSPTSPCSLPTRLAWPATSRHDTSFCPATSTIAWKVRVPCVSTAMASRLTAAPGFQASSSALGGSWRSTDAKRTSSASFPAERSTSRIVQCSAEENASIG